MSGSTAVPYIALGGVLVYGVVMWQLAKKRNQSDRCARCGAPLTDAQESGIPFDTDTEVTMCPNCASTTARNYRASYWFFTAAGVAMIVGAAVSVLSDAFAGKFSTGSLATGVWMALMGVLALRLVGSLRQWLVSREDK